MIRTQQEILQRFESADDFLSTQQGDLIEFMEFNYAKPFLQSEYLEKIDKGEIEWVTETDAKSKIIDYLPFAFEKAYSERGISAGRSMMHMKAWIWLDNEEFYNEIIDRIDNYDSYGLPALKAIAKHYGVEIPSED